MPTVSRYQLCCGCLPITAGICAIAIHCIVHSIFALCLILTSYYIHPNDILNYFAVTGYALLIMFSGPITWIVVTQNIRSIKSVACCLGFLTTFNLCCGISYFVWYFSFDANSMLDKAFLWRYGTTWVTSEIMPFTIWHIFTGFLLLMTLIWYYYAYMINLFAHYIVLMRSQEPRIPEIVIIENRIGHIGYPPMPMTHPYQPGNNTTAVQFPDSRGRDNRDNNPKAILD